VNVSSSIVQATIPGGLVIVAGGPLGLVSSNATTGSATADGSAGNTAGKGGGTSGSGTAIGAARAINYERGLDPAPLRQGAWVHAVGVTIRAQGPKPSDRFTAGATSGSGGADIGVAGSVAINIVDDTAEALISPSALVTAGGGDVTLTAAD